MSVSMTVIYFLGEAANGGTENVQILGFIKTLVSSEAVWRYDQTESAGSRRWGDTLEDAVAIAAHCG
jgi:hypothetical protein